MTPELDVLREIAANLAGIKTALYVMAGILFSMAITGVTFR